MRRYRFIVLALVLLAVSAWLMHGKETASADQPQKEVRLPRYPTPDEYQRRVARRTLLDMRQPTIEQPQKAPRDPLLEVLPYDEKNGSVIIEASAIRFSELGEKILECLDSNAARAIEEMREATGIDPLQAIDRIGVSAGALVVTGNFEGLKLGENKTTKYGDHGQIMEGGKTALWKDQLMLLDVDEATAKEAIDRLEGRSQRTEPTFPEHMAYGEVYGWVPVRAIAQLIPEDGDRRLGERLEAAADKVELHVSVSEDVGIVARVDGKDESIRDLGKSIGGAMALGRTFAASREEKALAEILEHARVVPRGQAFDVELALPSEVLLSRLSGGRCGQARDAGVTSDEVIGPGP